MFNRPYITIILMSLLVLAGAVFAKADSSSQKKFCNTYNPEHTQMTFHKGDGSKYHVPKHLSDSSKKHTQTKVQEWNGYCPPCSLKDQSKCKKLKCQTANRKVLGLYEGIEIKDDRWMRLANKTALKSVKHGGGPFGAVIVQIDDKTGRVIRYWVNHNHVTQWHDPTAHAEISTIRAAAHQLGVTDLGHINKKQSNLSQPHQWSHCVIYSSAEPCPMCLSAIYWAGIKTLVFAATQFDSAAQGVDFSDEMIYEELKKPYRKRQQMQVYQSTTNNSLDAFNYYKRQPVKRYGSENSSVSGQS